MRSGAAPAADGGFAGRLDDLTFGRTDVDIDPPQIGVGVEDLETSVHIAQGLGASSAYTWLKLPVVHEMERVMDAKTLPTLLLGGVPDGAPDGADPADG